MKPSMNLYWLHLKTLSAISSWRRNWSKDSTISSRRHMVCTFIPFYLLIENEIFPGLNMYSYMVATVSPYRDKIDQFFAILIESGLLDTFISWVRFSKDQHHAVQYRPEETLNSFISFECFLPMVYGLLFFQFFSILVFVCELMWSRIVRKVYPKGQWLRV